MAVPSESVASADPQKRRLPIAEEMDKSTILQELDNILASPPFRNSSRSKQFLSYVIQHRLDGHDELLKERSIGADLFHRPADYATGDDPVVRVQAGGWNSIIMSFPKPQTYASTFPWEPMFPNFTTCLSGCWWRLHLLSLYPSVSPVGNGSWWPGPRLPSTCY